jgi:hypothetical protein|tara:strand:+ start:675 stop:944 length:270 start_codon:yes stop_codon:yes gene_type:complete
MATYPKLPLYTLPKSVDDLFRILSTYTNELTRELDLEDQKQNKAPATKVFTVATVTSIGRPQAGDVAFSTSSGKFRGYVTTASGWSDFN